MGVNFFIGVPKMGAHFMPKNENWPKRVKMASDQKVALNKSCLGPLNMGDQMRSFEAKIEVTTY